MLMPLLHAPSRAAVVAMVGLALPATAFAQCTVYRLDMPDFDQRRSALPNNGRMYCVPTATANALAYISNHGYPSIFGGPRDWSRQQQYTYVTQQIQLMGLLMGTDPVDGTTLEGWFPIAKARANAAGAFGVSWYRSNFLYGMDPKDLSDLMRIGAVVLPIMGWYNTEGVNQWRRNGGHMVTMWGAFSTCGAAADMFMVYRDPANDDELAAQGPFTTTGTGFDRVPSWTFANRNELAFYPRVVYRLDNGGFLDGFAAFWPLFGLTTGPTLEDLTFYVPEPTTDDPGPRRFDAALPRGVIVGMAHSAIPTQGYVLTDLGRSGELHAINYADGSVTPIATMLSPRGLAIGRDGTAYVARSARIDRYGPLAAGGVGLIDSTVLPHQADAIYYDDAADELVALNIADRRLMRITRTMTVRRNDLIPTSASVLGEASVAVNPLDGKEWIAGSGSPALVRFGRDPGSGRLLPEAQVTLPGITNPRSLQFGDDGTLYVHGRDAIKAFVPDGAGGWRIDLTNPLHDTASGPVFTIGRSRTNADVATMADIDVLPPDTGLGEPDCRADLDLDGVLTIFDFLEFQNLFARGSTVADFDYDGRLTIFDFLAYQNAFAAGCP